VCVHVRVAHHRPATRRLQVPAGLRAAGPATVFVSAHVAPGPASVVLLLEVSLRRRRRYIARTLHSPHRGEGRRHHTRTSHLSLRCAPTPPQADPALNNNELPARLSAVLTMQVCVCVCVLRARARARARVRVRCAVGVSVLSPPAGRARFGSGAAAGRRAHASPRSAHARPGNRSSPSGPLSPDPTVTRQALNATAFALCLDVPAVNDSVALALTALAAQASIYRMSHVAHAPPLATPPTPPPPHCRFAQASSFVFEPATALVRPGFRVTRYALLSEPDALSIAIYLILFHLRCLRDTRARPPCSRR
jgi:hypothetical protein